MSDLAVQVEALIKEIVISHPEAYRYREPIVGFASADDPLFDQLDGIIGNRHTHPKELLPSARTIVVFFLPFAKEVVKEIRAGKNIVRIWSECYTDANLLLARIAGEVKSSMNSKGVAVVTEPPTENFNEEELTAQWAHKSNAVIAGIGTFGLNRLLITRSGTAGRLNSLVIDALIPPTPRPDRSYCLYFQDGSCGVCSDRCPSGALSREGFDPFRCDAYLDGKNVSKWEQGCGMCSSGPCSLNGF